MHPTHLPDPPHHETISAWDSTESIPMVPNPAYEHFAALASDHISMTKNPSYLPIKPWQREHMTCYKSCTTEPSPAGTAVPSRPLPCPPEIEEKRKQRQISHRGNPAPMPLPVQKCSGTSTVHGTEEIAHPEKVCILSCALR